MSNPRTIIGSATPAADVASSDHIGRAAHDSGTDAAAANAADGPVSELATMIPAGASASNTLSKQARRRSPNSGSQKSRLGRKRWLLAAVVWRLDGAGLGVSLAAHCLIGLAAAFFVLGQNLSPPEVAFLGQIADESDSEIELAPVQTEIDMGASGESKSAVDATTLSVDADAASLALDDLASGSINNGLGAGSGDGNGPGFSFFGTTAEARSIVFVVDMSGSMRGRRWARATSELTKSISRLKVEQKFYIVFFNDDMLPLFSPKAAPELVNATRENIRRARVWVSSQTPNSGTDPKSAMTYALSLKPEVIYLLTDGEVQDPAATLEETKAANKTGIPINTIAFESPDGAGTLQKLAAQNRGKYRFVK